MLLVSARDALLARLVLTNKASPKDLDRFRTLAFGRKASARSPAEMHAAAAAMLNDSGLGTLEAKVFDYLYSQSAPLKLMSSIDDAARLLHQASVCRGMGLSALASGGVRVSVSVTGGSQRALLTHGHTEMPEMRELVHCGIVAHGMDV